jgi:hypothetical protein
LVHALVPAPLDLREAGKFSDFGSLGQRQCIVDINAKIPDRVLDVCMPEQNLHGS